MPTSSLRHRIVKTIEISAAHSLPDLPPAHQCHHVHGHNYKIEVALSATKLDNFGMVLDFSVVSDIVKRFDHQDLNKFFSPTTAEVFSGHIWDILEREVLGPLNSGPSADHLRVDWISVWETERSKATLTR